MKLQREPTARQLEIRDAPELGLLVTAPAGCGKTEALALRIKGLIEQGKVSYPRRLLVLTFTNRAKENIQERLREHVDERSIREYVTVHNFHGLSARIIRAHGNVIGIGEEWQLPLSDWVGEECRKLRLNWKQSNLIRANLQHVKLATITDEEVRSALVQVNHPTTSRIEQKRTSEKILTYEDLPRLADLILQNDHVAELYREHFCGLVVDEFQDLTPQQLRIVQRIGWRRTTYAGDLAQGIYSFAGADPEVVLNGISREIQRTITFAESHRSSPSVLNLVNAMIPWTGGVELAPAAGKLWPGDGLATYKEFDRQADEADWVISFCRALLKRAPNQRVGVLSRTKKRREVLDNRLEEGADLSWHRWDDPVFDSSTAPVMRGLLGRLRVSEYSNADEPISYLASLIHVKEPHDPSTLELVQAGLEWIADLLQEGTPVEAIRQRIRFGDGETLLTVPGVHLLTGHTGKGQQFDWVVVLGLEEGSIPAFQAESDEAITEEARILSVMMSRARHGVITTRTEVTLKPWGDEVEVLPSRFIQNLECAEHYVKWEDAKIWLNGADWEAIQSMS
ncbi:ATP-dependent helicase [Micrococcaceae bacterium RIT802]|nr:ATP-dependent helicase [Micrococcaceae bacterium RIT 802]